MNKPQNSRAVTQLRTWLSEVGIEIRARKGNDTVVVDARGQEQTVTVLMADSEPSDGALTVSGASLTARRIKDGFEVFMDLQRSLGFEAKMPVDRGRIPDHKLANNADMNLAAFRHTEFRRAPDPSADKFKAYDKAITRSCWKFFRTNQTRCLDNMMGIEDLKTYAQVWMTNFVALYELQGEVADLHSQNEGLLTTYLSQRFEDLRKLLVTKERNELAKLDDAFIGTRGRTYNYMNKDAWFGDEVLIEEGEADEGDEFIDTSTTKGRMEYKVRQAVSSEVLEDRLAALGHDKMVELLAQAAENDRIHPDAAAEAQTRLEKHRSECNACKQAAAEVVPAAVESAPVEAEPAPAPAAAVATRQVIVDEAGRVFESAGEAARAHGGMHKDHVKAILRGEIDSFRGHTFRFESRPAKA